MRYIASCLVLALTAGCTLGRLGTDVKSSPGSFNVAAGKPAAMTVNRLGQPLLSAEVNGTAGNFLIDTGATQSCLVIPFAAKVAATENPTEKKWVTSGTGRVQLAQSKVNSLRVGNLTLRDSKVLLVADGNVNVVHHTKQIVPLDGLLGENIFRKFRAVLDFAERTVVFFSPGEPLPPAEGKVIARLLSPAANEIAVEVTVNGRKALFQIDTGVNFSGAVSPRSPLAGILAKTTKTPRPFYSLEQTLEVSSFFKADELKIGDLSSQGPEFYAIDYDPDAKTLRIDGLLGSWFLLEHRLVVDYGRMEVRQIPGLVKPATNETPLTQATNAK